nr:hypothetical protein [Candidatus Sigynarchaeota archaeon]
MVEVPVLETIVHLARDYIRDHANEKPRIGIGVEGSYSFVKDIVDFLKDRSVDATSTSLVLYCNQDGVSGILPAGTSARPSDHPSVELVNDLRDGKIDAVIRGKLSSSAFLGDLKRAFQIDEMYRLALLATNSGIEFFFGPVGIDEAATPAQKRQLVSLSSLLLQKLGIAPCIYVLSAGRLGDVGRNPAIRESITQAIALVESMKPDIPSGAIHHGEILIESAIASAGNVILAPDGVSGNLAYRTLVHLGGGHSYGAFYLNAQLPGPVIDTSRVGPPSEYAGALLLALCGLALRDR